MKKMLLIGLFFALLWGCKRDYPLNQYVTPQIVVNSILCSDSTIRVDLWWSKKLDVFNMFERVREARVVISEDGAPLFEATSGNSSIEWDYHPKEGSTYSITVDVAGQKQVSASTKIPARPSYDCHFIKIESDGRHTRYSHFKIENLLTATTGDISSLMLSVTGPYEPSHGYAHYQDICTMAPFADNFNCERDATDATLKESTEEYTDFMRVSSDNIDKVYPITFSVYAQSSIDYPDDYRENYEKYRDVEFPAIYDPRRVIVVAATRDYDLYFKTKYLNQNTEGVLAPTFHKMHSNIKNGLGIFAGYSQLSFLFDLNQ